MEGFVQSGGCDKEVISKRKERIVSGQVIFSWGQRGKGKARTQYVDNLTAADQNILD